jgi:hypothetical protein
MVSTANILCGRCNRPLLRAEDVERLAQLDSEEAEGRPSGLADGNIKVAADVSLAKSLGDGFTRREAIGVLATAFIGALVAAYQGQLGLKTGFAEWDEQERAKVRADLLTINDVRSVDQALLSVSDLKALATSFRGGGRYALASLLEALAGHVFGIFPREAKRVLDELIERQEKQDVLAYLLFRRAKVRVLLGEVRAGLTDLDKSIKLTGQQDVGLLLTRLRQAANHAYISIPEEDVQDPDKWIEMRKYLTQAMDILNISATSDIESQIAAARRSTVMESTIGVLFTYNMLRAAESRGSTKECGKTLKQIIEILTTWQDYDPITAWNCHTPLAAAAIRLGHPDVAKIALVKAASFAQSSENSPIARYASGQRQSKGIEWLFHKLQWVPLHIEKARKSRSKTDCRNELKLAERCLKEVLEPQKSERTVLLLRAAKLYQWQLRSMLKDRKDIDKITVEAFNSPAYSHWTYFSNLPKIR